MPIVPATREKLRLRMAILGATGSGKTASALLFATALARHYGGKIGLIDTQHRQSRDYVNTRFAPLGFDVFDIESGNPDAYINALKQFAKNPGEYCVVIVDSMSTAWQGEGGVLEQAGDSAEFKDWGPAKRSNFKLLTTIQKSPFHVIATVLADTQYLIKSEELPSGKSKMTGVEIIGTKPIQDKKMMPHFGIQASMDQYHRLTVTRTSFEAYDRMIVEKPGEDWMQPVVQWLEKGDEPQAIEIAERAASDSQIREYYELTLALGIDKAGTQATFFKKYGSKPEDCTQDFLEEKLTELREKARINIGRLNTAAAAPVSSRRATIKKEEPTTIEPALQPPPATAS